MAKIRDLPLEPPAVRGWLRDAGIKTSDDLWREIGPDFEVGLARVEQSARVAADRLLHALGAAAAEEPRRLSFLEALFCLGLAALALLAALRIAEGFGFADFPLRSMSESTDQVVVKREVPAFQILTADDLDTNSRPRTEKGLADPKKAVGSYLLRPLQKGDVLHPGDLGPGALQGRWIVTLSLPSARMGPLVERGSDVLLLLSPRRGGAPGAVEAPASILDVRRSGETALVTLALPADRRPEIANALATSEVFFPTRAP
jgi:SAF domain